MNAAPQSGGEPRHSREERTWGVLCHLSALLGLVIPPVGQILGPLVVWLAKKDIPFVDDQAKESLNFQISMTLYSVIAYLLVLTIVLALLAVPLLIVLAVFDVIQVILASVKARDGIPYRYPFTIRFVP